MNKDARRAQEEINRNVIGFLNNNYEAIYDCKERPV